MPQVKAWLKSVKEKLKSKPLIFKKLSLVP